MSYEPLDSVNFQGGLDVSSSPLSPRSASTLGQGTWNGIVSSDNLVKPWSGGTGQGADTGSAKLLPFGSSWGGIKSYDHSDNSFSTSSISANAVTTTTPHGWVTGIEIQTSGAPAPTGLPSGTYYGIVTGLSTLKFASTLANALLGTALPIASAGAATITLDVSNSNVEGSGNWMQDIGLSRWGIGQGQPMIAGVPVEGFTLSTNLQVQIASGGVYGVPNEAGLAQPSAPGIAIVDTTGVISNSMSAKIARSRPTGAVSVASEVSAVITPQGKRIRVGPLPAASTGQTHWRFYFPFQGFGGSGVHYLGSYNGQTDVPESDVAAGSVGGSQALGYLYFNSVNPTASDTISLNGCTPIIFGTDVVIGANSSVTAQSFVDYLNASTDPLLTVATYTVVGDTVTITYDTQGVVGNTFTLAASTGTATITPSGAVLAGGVDGIERSLEFNFQDGDLIAGIEASFSNYPPPAGTHAVRLNTVMNVIGCYGDGAPLSASNTGTCIAVSKENDYESYVPTSLLYLPGQVVDVLARPIDDYAYIALDNSIQALQYVGNRGDELPSCTLTTILPDTGIQYQYNWCHFRGCLLMYTTQGVLMLMDETGAFDTTFANPVTKLLRTFAAVDTGVAYDPINDSIVVMHKDTLLVYSMQAGIWRQIFLPDYGLRGTCLPSGVSSGRMLYFSLTEDGVETAYTYDTADAIAPMSFECNYQNAGGIVLDDIYEMAIAAQTTVDTTFAVAINQNLTKTVFRYCRVIPSGAPASTTVLLDDSGNVLVDDDGNVITDVSPYDGILIDDEGTFTPDMVGKKFILFGDDVDGIGGEMLEGVILQYFSPNNVQMSVGTTATLDKLLLFVGTFTDTASLSLAEHLSNFWPNLVEVRSYQIACYLRSAGLAGNVLTVDLAGTRYQSSRAL